MPSARRIDISVVVPVYGCPSAIPELHRRLVETLEGMGVSFELVLVNDHCPRGSWEEIKKVCDVDRRVIGLNLSRNYGQIQAITAGLDLSCGEWVVVMDCDLQDRPESIPLLFSKAKEGYDVVFAQRQGRKDSGLTKILSKAFYKVYDYFTDGNYDNSISNFSISRRVVIDAYCSMREHHRAYTIFIKWLGFKQAHIPLPADERFEGESSYDFKKKMRMAADIITAQSDKPLRFSIKLGFLIALLAFVYLVYLVINYFLNPGMLPGWTSTVGAVFLMGGLMLMAIGVVGIYVGNIFNEVKDRPLYVIAERLNCEEEDRS